MHIGAGAWDVGGVFRCLRELSTVYPQGLSKSWISSCVGHEQGKIASHFMALNLHGRIQVIEFPGGDSSRAKVYQGPQLSGEQVDLAPVTLQFVDRNGDHQPDMVVQCNGIEVWFKNAQGSFLST